MIDLTVLTNKDRAILEKGITLEEVAGAFSSFAPRKSPGLNGLPLEWYDTFGDSLAPRLLRVFKSARSNGRLPLSMRALVILIPKGGEGS